MKFVYLSSLFMACALSAGAQGIYQFEDPGFEKTWTDSNRPGYGWYSFKDADGSAAYWGNLFGVPYPQHVTENGNSYVKLTSIWATAANANGNMTTGRVHMGATNPENSQNYNYSDIDSKDGTGYMKFAGIPDKITFRAKFKKGDSNSSHAGRIQLFLHDGGISEFKDPVPDNEKDVQNQHQIAYASKLIPTTTYWEDYEEEFTYTYNSAIPENRYLLASITTNPKPGESKDDELCIDDIYFVYYSDLSSLTYGNTTITSFPADGKIDFSKEPYSPEKLSYILHGKGATAELGEYNKENGTIELTVKGNDFGHEVDPSKPNKTTYTLQFAVPEVSEVVGDYESLVSVELFDNTTPSKNTISITDDNGKAAFTMKNFEFAGNSVGDVTLSNTVLSYSDDGSINITADEQPLTLSMKKGELEIPLYTKVTLKDGNISKIGDKKVLNATVKIKWYMTDAYDEATVTNITATITAMPFTTTTSEDGKTLTVTGDVAADLVSLVVPTDADVNAIDLTGANLEKVMATSAFGVKNSNTLFYVNAEENNLTGNNVVKGTECDNFVLTDGQSFNAPEGFTAKQITYKRATVASTDEKDEVYTFVLPFTFTADKVNGTVYELSGVNAGVLDFTSVEGSMELKANRPYLVVSNGTQLLNASAFSGEVVATGDLTNEVYGGVTMVGAYEVTPITSDASWYGYNAKGEFVKATSGTINPFRTAIKSTGSQSSFALKLDGTVTGIVNLENPNAKVDVYTISGVCVRKNVPAASALNGLSRGVYIVGGQKVVK